jgi:hypothetical protein
VRRWLTENPHLKALALTLTVLLYASVVGEKTAVREYTLNTRIGHLPADTVVLNELPPVRVAVRANARAFARLEAEAPRVVTVNIDDPTQERWEVRASDIGMPRHVTVESIYPRWIPLEIDVLEQRSLPVRAVVRGQPARGFEASTASVEPQQLAVLAPTSYFADLDAVFTDALDISGATGTVVADVGLAIQRPYVTFPERSSVQVTVNVSAVVETRTLDGIPMLVSGRDAARCVVDVDTVTVSVTGPKTVVDALDPADLFAAVECSAFAEQGAGIYTPTPSIKNLPASVTVVDLVPAALRLTVLPPADADGSGGDER